MKENKSFCEVCRNDVSYIVKEQRMEGTLKGEKYSYIGKVARCAECGAEVYSANVNDFNLKALYDCYREKNGIIALEKILAIPLKYAIGKRPLSILLGWGEQTFSRYCDGDMPTKQYSEILQQLYDDPIYYEKLLEENKSNLKTTTSYEKSKRALATLRKIYVEAVPKIDSAIAYLSNQCEDITPLALQKALYYIQGFHYAFYNTYFFKEDCEAWVHGPVYREIYSRYKCCCSDPIESVECFDVSVFSVAEKAVLDSVVKNICCYSGKVLERFTHSEIPWIETRGDLAINTVSSRIIHKDLIGRYFKAVKDKDNMINPNDIKAYSQRMFAQM